MAVQFKPEGYHTLTPFLYVNGAATLMDFLGEAFGAIEKERHLGPEGLIMHAEMKIGDSMVMLGDAHGDMPAMPGMLYLYVEDCDALYNNAIAAGATSLREPRSEFYGDRTSGVTDMCGNQWWISTHVEDVSEEELTKRMAAMTK
jgi:uncharacterized glyoxalase superfamily protein PhnB